MESFLIKFKRLSDAKPVPTQLGVGKDNNFYWIYYAGMGQYSFYKVSTETSIEIKKLLRYDTLGISEELLCVDVHAVDLDKMITIKFNKVVLNDL